MADPRIPSVDRANIQLKIESIHDQRREYLTLRPISGKSGIITKMFQDFEALTFAIAKADGSITMNELMDRSIYEFYRYKQLLAVHIGRIRGTIR